MRRTLAMICVAALVLISAAESRAATPSWLGDIPGLGEIAPDPHPTNAPVNLAGCTVTNPLFSDDPARVRRFVPLRYELGTNAFFGPLSATIIASVLFCERIRVDRRSPKRTVLALIAVQVQSEPVEDDAADAVWTAYTRSTANVLPSSSWYLIAAQTNNRELAARLRRAGLPVEHTARLAYRADYDDSEKSDSVVIRMSGGRYRLSTTTLLPDSFVHNNDWMFWHDGSRGARAGFFLHLHAMSDSSCGYWISALVSMTRPCGATLTAPPKSRIAKVLGATMRETPYAFNHPPSRARGYIDVTREVKAK